MSDLNTTSTDFESEPDSKVTLISMENERFSLTKKAATMSELIRIILDGDPSETEIPLPHIKSSILDRVVQYLKYHVDNVPKEIEKPLGSAILSDILDPFDVNLVELSIESLFDLLNAATYLHIKPLLELTSAKVASLFKNKTPDQIRKTFNLVKDFTQKEEEAAIQENRLALDA